MKFKLALFFVFASRALFAVDGQVLITQASVTASGGFPLRITQAGSYKLAGNLVSPLNTTTILIESNDVELDLNGFNVKCSYNQAAAFQSSCISDNGITRTSTVVRNGSVEVTATAPAFNIAYFVVGIDLSRSTSTTLEKVHFTGTTSNFSANGAIFGRHSILSRCTFAGSASPSVTCPSVVEGNTNATLGAGSNGSGCVGAYNVGFIPF
jgi:hypothetical protein